MLKFKKDIIDDEGLIAVPHSEQVVRFEEPLEHNGYMYVTFWWCCQYTALEKLFQLKPTDRNSFWIDAG